MYGQRWQVESVFVRFLNPVRGLKRLFSDRPEAVAIQVYCAVIAALLLAQAVGGRVTADGFRMLRFYLQGWADDEELRAFPTKLCEREAGPPQLPSGTRLGSTPGYTPTPSGLKPRSARGSRFPLAPGPGRISILPPRPPFPGADP